MASMIRANMNKLQKVLFNFKDLWEPVVSIKLKPLLCVEYNTSTPIDKL